VAARFAIEARERRNVGILAAERGIQRAAAMGALAMTQAKLEYAMRVAPASANAARLSSSDPWLGIDSTYSGTVYVDSVPVAITARDLGEQLNINQLTETDLQSFFTFLLRDFSKATQLSQAIMDWRDADSLPRPSGAERDDYIKAGLLALPTNASFRDVEELQNVMGMTPEIYATIAPFLTTRGNGQVNINTAPIPVLRALPGMTDAIVAAIIQYRSGGRRIDNVAQVIDVGATRGGGRGGAGVTTLQGRLTTTTNNVEFTFEARVGPQAPPSKLTVVMQRAGNQGTLVSYKQWQ
jgi:type II secretory pathway component PulK